MMTRRLLVLAALLLILPSRVQAAIQDQYFGIYLPGGKIGFMHVRKETGTKYAGKPAVRTDNETQITINALGNASRTVSITTSYNDPKTGAPFALQSRSEGAGRVSTVSAVYDRSSVRYVADIQGTKRSGTLSLKVGESFLADPSSAAGDLVPKVGDVIAGKSFIPETLRLADESVVVVRKERVAVGAAKAVDAFVVEDRSEMGKITLFLSGEGETLLLRFALGMEARLEPKAVALRVPPASEIAKRADLAVSVGIIPTGRLIADPRGSTRVRYRLSGGVGDLPASDNRQTMAVVGTGASRVATLDVSANPLPDRAGVSRFAKSGDAPENLRPYLSPSDYVASDSLEFVALAREATGGETDLARAAAKVAAFTHGVIRTDSSVAVLRTATDINRDRRGVCREYATFFTAVARAAGIPTRICVGVVLSGDSFVYHAWPEVWVGETGGWVALEPTWGRPFADATHIKLAQGEITDLYRVADDMGRYRIEVVN